MMKSKELLQTAAESSVMINAHKSAIADFENQLEQLKAIGGDTPTITPKIKETQDKMKDEISRLAELQTAAFNLIMLLQNEKQKAVLFKHYLEHKTIQTIADEMNLTIRHCYRLQRWAFVELDKNQKAAVILSPF